MPRISDEIWWRLRELPGRLYGGLFLAMQVAVAVLAPVDLRIVLPLAAGGTIVFLHATVYGLGMPDWQAAAAFSVLGSVLPGYALILHGWWWPLAVMWGGLGLAYVGNQLIEWAHERSRHR